MPEPAPQPVIKKPRISDAMEMPDVQLCRPSRSIPVDLYKPIIRYLAVPELSRCLRVSRAFYQHVLPLLYESVTISFEDDECQRGELSGRYLPVVRLPEDEADVLKYKGDQVEDDEPLEASPAPSSSSDPGWSRSLDHLLPYRPGNATLLSHLSTHTRNLTITPHQYGCRNVPPLDLPHLNKLYIVPGWTLGTHAGLCSALANIRPRRIVFENQGMGGLLQTCLNDVWKDVEGRPGVAPAWVSEITLNLHRNDVSPDSGFEPFHRMPDTLQRLIMVVPSCGELWQSGGGSTRTPAHWGPVSDIELRRLLPSMMVGQAKVIEILGVDTMKDVFNQRGYERVQREIREGLREILLKRKWTQEAAQMRADGIVFTKWSDTEWWFCGKKVGDGT